MKEGAIYIHPLHLVKLKFADYTKLVKLRLTMMVVFSAGIGFVAFGYQSMVWSDLFILLFSGLCITGSANGINQIIERKLDALMTRTSNRPLVTGRIHPAEAAIVTAAMGVLGALLLGLYINMLSAFIGIASLVVYAFIYTPLKRVTRWSVIAGAVSGAAPPVIGYTAAAGSISELCILLFALQFVWQLPHFWAVAWILHDDYSKAGFRLLPSVNGRSKVSAIAILVSTFMLMPIGVYMMVVGYVGIFFGFLILALNLNFFFQASMLLKTRDLKEARRVMFGSFYYLPLLLLLILLGIIF
ncbi:MAG: protoheme IX farnesyltransferase [Bacteroidetes bacterium]|nr:protoheme IX farnesyltransferase [Bacteroidota bacterium]